MILQNVARQNSILGWIFIISFNFASQAASAQTSQNPCESAGVSSIQVLSDPANPASPLVPFKFRYLRGAPNAPVVIQIPGGPGESLISFKDPRPDARMGWIQIDPRNTGCNLYNIPMELATTKIEVQDIVHVVSALQLKDYILFGGSYGTVVATQLASFIEQTKLSPPKAVILQGVLGKAIEYQEQEKAFIKQWERVHAILPDSVKAELGKETPYGISNRAWVAFLVTHLYIAEGPEYGDILLDRLRQLTDDTERPNILKIVADSKIDLEDDPVYKFTYCRELSDLSGDLKLVNGKLAPFDTDLCKKGDLKNPYDSAKYQVRSPLFYFAGVRDPATPYEQATYHYSHQMMTAKKVFVSVPAAGHAVLSYGLRDCYKSIMNSIVFGEGTLKNILSTCKLESRLTE